MPIHSRVSAVPGDSGASNRMTSDEYRSCLGPTEAASKFSALASSICKLLMLSRSLNESSSDLAYLLLMMECPPLD